MNIKQITLKERLSNLIDYAPMLAPLFLLGICIVEIIKLINI